MKNRDVLIGAIRGCKTEEILESTLELFDVKDMQERIDLIIEAMYNPQVFFSNGNPSLEQRYIMTIEMFLTFEWKVTEIFSKAGMC